LCDVCVRAIEAINQHINNERKANIENGDLHGSLKIMKIEFFHRLNNRELLIAEDAGRR